MKEVYVIEARLRQDWKAYYMSLSEGNARHFCLADTDWHSVGGCDAYTSLRRAIGEAQAFVCDPYDVRVKNYLTEKVVKYFAGKPAPEVGSQTWRQQVKEATS